MNAKFASNVEESSKGSEAAKRALADLEKIKVCAPLNGGHTRPVRSDLTTAQTELNATRTDRDVLAARIGYHNALVSQR